MKGVSGTSAKVYRVEVATDQGQDVGASECTELEERFVIPGPIAIAAKEPRPERVPIFGASTLVETCECPVIRDEVEVEPRLGSDLR
jgi:hypothetical protein